MQRVWSVLAVGLAMMLPATAVGQFNSEVVGFDSDPDIETSREMFRIPEFSGTTAGFIIPNTTGQVDNNNAFRASGFQTAGAAAMNIFFEWVSASDPNAWVRVSTFGAAERPNPALHLGGKVRFKIVNRSELFQGSVGIVLGVRETGADVPQLANGGTTGDIEFVGVTGVNDPNGASTPIPAAILAPSAAAYDVEFDLATGNVFVNGSNQGGGIAAFTGDGVLSAPNSRGTLEHIAFVNVSGDGATMISVHIDEMQFEAPIADPVIPPSVVAPIINGDTTVAVADVNPAADRVRLYRDGIVILTDTDPNAVTVFTVPGGVTTGESFTADQRVGGTTSAQSAPVVALDQPSPYGLSFVIDENGDGSCSFDAPGGWEFVGADSLTGIAGGLLYPDGVDLFIDDSQWQTIDFDLTAPAVAWLGGNGTLDPSPTGLRSIDSIWWNVNPGTNVGPHEFFLDSVQVVGPNEVILDQIHSFEDGIAYMGNTRGQSTIGATSGLSGAASFDGTNAHRVAFTYPDTDQEALGLYHNIGGACGTGPTFTDAGAIIRMRILARVPADPNDLPIPSVQAPIVGATSDVVVNNDPNATAVQLYVNGVATGAPVDPLGATSVTFGGLSLMIGDSVSATQTLGGEETRFAYPRGVDRPIAPSIETPIAPGSTSVTLNDVLFQTGAEASEVEVVVNGGTEVATATPAGTTVVVTLVNPLQTGDTVVANQTVNGAKSLDSDEATVAFTAPIIYQAPAEGDSTVRVQALNPTADTVTLRVFAAGDPNDASDFSANPGGATVFDVPVSGLTAGDTLLAFQTVSAVDSVPSGLETVTVATTTSILCDDFEDPNTIGTNWTVSTAPGLVSSATRNATVGGALSAYEDGSEGRIEQGIADLVPTATEPVVWNVNIYDELGTGAFTGNQFAQLNGQVADFYYMHIGMSGPSLQPFLDPNRYQFRAVGNGGPDWINLDQIDAPVRSVGWHTFTVIHKGDFIDIYVDGLLSAKNIPLSFVTTLDRARIGPGALPGTPPEAYYDDFCVETGKVRFGEIEDQGPTCGSGCEVDGGCADIDGDGDVDLSDLATVLANFGAATSTGDTNGDGNVNLTDLANVLSLFGTACP